MTMSRVPLDPTGRICVTSPYYALDDLTETAPGSVTAGVTVQTDPGLQAAVIGLGEMGRHLAILGLCAAATLNPRTGQHYYLARKASARVAAAGDRDGDPKLIGTAHARLPSPRRAEADTELRDRDGGLVSRLAVEYDVVSAPVFRRMFAQRAVSTPPTPHNPYVTPPRLSGPTMRGAEAEGRITVTPEMCPGHFDGFPAFPVAVVATVMASVVDHLVADAYPAGTRWRPVGTELEAHELVWPGETLTVSGHLADSPSAGRRARCAARVGDRVIATTETDFDPVR
ncbi:MULTISPECIES: hypothetical protein [unclassified Streptomyces]|uniref:hypothetical protein n=1 Tax=unclassified Streptomyces TaxID=2593676 RepID=UPI00278C0731|nr:MULTISPECIES: hypothetical protein [unclassified Streptomyces]